MHLTSTIIAIIAASAGIVSAQTPPGFMPGSRTPLVVAYGRNAVTGGNVLERNLTLTMPTVGLRMPSASKNLAIIMIDLDIPTGGNASAPHTLLHWLQTNLTAATQPTTLNLTTGPTQAYLLQNSSSVAPVASYNPPNPPARVPLSHRYTLFVADLTGVSAQGLSRIMAAAIANRRGFDGKVLLDNGVTEQQVLAGTWYNVTNPGPATDGPATGVPMPPVVSAAPTGIVGQAWHTITFAAGVLVAVGSCLL